MKKSKIVLVILALFIFSMFLQEGKALLIDDLVSYYTFDETVGVFLDTRGINNGTVNGPIRGVTGILDNSLLFDGIDDNVSIPDDATLNFPSTLAISVWFNRTGSPSTDQTIIGRGPAPRYEISSRSSRLLHLSVGTTIGSVSLSLPGVIPENVWTHVVLNANGSDIIGYVNGVEMNRTSYNGALTGAGTPIAFGGRTGSEYLNGSIDEAGFWNRSLTAGEVDILYNDGLGRNPFKNVNLNSPEDGFITLEGPIIFNVTVTPIDMNLTNATLEIYNKTGGIFNRTTNIITGDFANTTIWNISSFILSSYEWSVFACAQQGLNIDCSSSKNRSFDVGYVINDSYFDNTAFETDTELFQFNITTIPEVLSVSAILNYNGTGHIADVSCEGVNCSLTSSIDVPLISGGSIVQEFFFQTTLFTADDSLIVNLTSDNQTVSSIFFDVCNTTLTVPSLNFTVFDEKTNEKIEPFYLAGEFEFWLGGGETRKQMSFSNLTANELQLCIDPPDREFFIEDTIEYNDVINSSVYSTRNYYFQMDTITNTTRHIPLFLLDIDDSTSFILLVRDQNLIPISEAIIEIQRFNVGTGNFSTVQIAKTGGNGKSVGFFEIEVADYRFIIKVDGVIVLTTIAQKIIPESSPFTLTFTVGDVGGLPWSDFEDLQDLTKSIVFNDSTNITSYTYSDTSGNFTSARFLVQIQDITGFLTTICDTNSSQSTAILTCYIGNTTGTYIASGFITRTEGTYLVEQILIKVQTFAQEVGLYGVFLGFFLILISAFAFKFNEIAGIFLINATVIGVNIIGLINFGYTFIFGMIAVSIILMVLLKK